MLKLDLDLICRTYSPVFGFIANIPVVAVNGSNRFKFNFKIPSNVPCINGCVLEIFTDDGDLICIDIMCSDACILNSNSNNNNNIQNSDPYKNQASNNKNYKNQNLNNNQNSKSRIVSKSDILLNKNFILNSRNCPDLNIGLIKKKFTNTLFLKCLCDISRGLGMSESNKVSNIISGKNGSNFFNS